jgi:hypothetical protein
MIKEIKIMFLTNDCLAKIYKSIPELFSPDESKRAEKKLELTLSQAFLGLDESKKADKPTLDLS